MLKTETRVKAKNFEQKEIGDLIPSSKLLYIWHLIIDSHVCKIELVHRPLLKSFSLILDGKLVLEKGANLLRNSFRHSFAYLNFKFVITEVHNSMKLTIDELDFDQIKKTEISRKFLLNDDQDETEPEFPVEKGSSCYFTPFDEWAPDEFLF